MSTNSHGDTKRLRSNQSDPPLTKIADARRRPRGAAAAQAGFDYQLDVSILAALQLLLIFKAAMRLVLEPANEDDLEADPGPHVPGRLQPSATVGGGYKLVLQVKMDNGEPWLVEDFEALLKYSSDKRVGTEKHYIISTNRTLAIAMFDAHRQTIAGLGRAAPSALRVHELMQASPIVTIRTVSEKLAVSFPTASTALENLARINVVRETTGRLRGRIYAYSDYLALLDRGTDPLPA